MNKLTSLLLFLVLSAALSSAQARPAASPSPAPALALQGVPAILQGYNDCGPASIAMVLGYYGIQLPVKTVSQATKATPNGYMSAGAIQPYVAQYGLVATTFSSGQVENIKQLIALGVPVIALQYYQQVGKLPHFRVVRGYDDRAQTFYLADPLLGYAYISYHSFDVLWNTQGRLFVAVYPPNMSARVMHALRLT